jgi:hypothetical protein
MEAGCLSKVPGHTVLPRDVNARDKSSLNRLNRDGPGTIRADRLHKRAHDKFQPSTLEPLLKPCQILAALGCGLPHLAEPTPLS